MSKYVYTYDVKHIGSGRKIAVGFSGKSIAQSLALAAVNNRPGHDFKVVQVRKPNPEYAGV